MVLEVNGVTTTTTTTCSFRREGGTSQGLDASGAAFAGSGPWLATVVGSSIVRSRVVLVGECW